MPNHDLRADPLGQGLFWFTGLVFFVSVISGFYLFYSALAGPEFVDRAKSWEVDETEVIRLMEQSIEREATFERGWKKDPENKEIFGVLEEAIGFQRHLKAIDPENAFGSLSRLEKLLQRLEDTKGKILYAESKTFSEKAAQIAAQGDTVSAVPLLEQALSNQEWINAHLKNSDFSDIREAARLRHWLTGLRTVDAVEEVNRFHEEGKVAYADHDFDLAEGLFERAITIQESINLNLPESKHVRWRLVQELKDYQRRIEAGRLNERVELLLQAAENEFTGDHLERALNLQAIINEKYSTTEFANPERLAFLKSRVVSDLSQAHAALLMEQSEQLSQLLRLKDWTAVHTSLLDLEATVREFLSEFPEALLPDPDLEAKIKWISKMEPQLDKLVALVENRLVKHPAQDIQMFNTEVDQTLFEMVLDANPSRWPGENKPVDSVTFLEALEFCQRLEWALGKPVVLPRLSWVSVFSNYLADGEGSWFSDQSGFQSQPVQSSKDILGFYDLFGNLAEWVTTEEDSQAAGLYGGSGADSIGSVRETPLNEVAENFRSRWAGFRFCVLP